MRELSKGEAAELEGLLKELAAHHNEVSVNFAGKYPKREVSVTLASFEKALESGSSRIAVIEDDDGIQGFCKIDITGDEGKLDYLIVSKILRGSGCGSALVNWALGVFRQSGVRTIEVKVVDGNDAQAFYEKLGFRVASHILRMDI